jgi:hypothetical protein
MDIELMSFRQQDLGLFEVVLTGDLACLQLVDIFWSGTPAAFQVLTRAISWDFEHALKNSTLMYIDDIITGLSYVEDVESDLLIARDVCTALLVFGAVVDDKT